MNKLKIIKIDKKDYMRALLTDTSPSDVPIIFSNDGLYINYHKFTKNILNNNFEILDSIYLNIISPIDNINSTVQKRNEDQKKQSYPLKYKIIKNSTSLRTLSLIHPRAQKNYCEFYRKYSDAITSICSNNLFSIRSPYKVSSSFYSSELDPSNKYKEINIDTLETELQIKHASSYFCYSGFNRLYKFYNSQMYISLEKKYESMWMLDIANCFDSIYTHTISWAIKNKEFIKEYVKYSNQFCQEFDTLIQRSNNNETNGVPIGSEVSRIFSEIIFQSIDTQISENLLNKHKLCLGIDYSVLRYVDDYFVFAKDIETTERVFDEISDQLSHYNLYISESKLKKYQRPFCTEKSISIIGVKPLIDELEQSLFDFKDKSNNYTITPRKIYKKNQFIHNFIDKVKALLTKNNYKGYSEVSNYLISTFTRKSIKLISNFRKNHTQSNENNEKEIIFRDAILILLELSFFFYSMNPTAPSSNQLSKLIIIINQFFQRNLIHMGEYVRTAIMKQVAELKFNPQKNDERIGFISLERLNIILATSDFGKNHLISPNIFSYLESDNISITYFDIISFIYYFKNHPIYLNSKNLILSIAKRKLNSNFNLAQDAESAHLFLDLIGCPFVDLEFKRELLNKYLIIYEPKLTYPLDVDKYLSDLSTVFWFVKWKDLNIVKLLERKELKSSY